MKLRRRGGNGEERIDRLLVTGASGFIGSHLVRLALASDYRVTVLVQPGDPLRRLGDVAKRLSRVEGDLSDPASLSPLFDDPPDACIHLAWYAEPGKYLTGPENVACLTGSLALLQGLLRARCHRIVMAGTCFEYAFEAGVLDEDSPTRPITLYAACKLALGLIGRHLANAAGARFAWGRIFYLYGPEEDPRRVVPAAIQALTGNKPFDATSGEQVRDYLHVEDVASAFLLLAERGGNGVYNICSGEAVTLRQLLETIGDLTGRRKLIRFGAAPPRFGDPASVVGDSLRLREFGWAPRFALEEGLRHTLRWWRERKE